MDAEAALAGPRRRRFCAELACRDHHQLWPDATFWLTDALVPAGEPVEWEPVELERAGGPRWRPRG